MQQYMFAALLAGVALVAGCARASVSSPASSSVVAASATATDLSGTWRGFVSWVGGTQWVDDGEATVQINGDGTFTATITPVPASSNLAKASNWSGTVVSRGDRVVFRTSQGPSVTLVRSGNTLYGVAKDLLEVPVMILLMRK